MNALLRQRLKDFSRKHDYPSLKESMLFEKYVIELFLQQFIFGNKEAIDSVNVEEPGDGGIDGIAIFVNNQLLDSVDDLDDFLQEGNRNDIQVFFFQAKTSSKIEGNLVARFLHAVDAFSRCAAGENLALDDALLLRLPLLEAVIQRIDDFRTSRLPLTIYYITASESSDAVMALEDPQVINALNAIQSIGLYQDIDFRICGMKEIDKEIQKAKGVKTVKIKLEDKTEINTDRESLNGYLALVSLAEVLKLIADENMVLREGIFDDNVRLYQGENSSINQDIAQTLRSDDRELFPYLNNGLTIICPSIDEKFSAATLSFYQIVNGGQTSVEILNYYHHLINEGCSRETAIDTLSNIYVTVKLIATGDPDIAAQVTVATNSQNVINAEDISATHDHAKRVEEYFGHSGKKGLRYLRQSGRADTVVKKAHQFSTVDLIRAFVSVVQNRSSDAISSPGKLKSDKTIWNTGYDPQLYYFSAFLVAQVDSVIARERGEFNIRPALYHIAAIVANLKYPELAKINDAVLGRKVLAKSELRRCLDVIPSSEDLENEDIQKSLESLITKVVKYVRDESSLSSLARGLRKDDVRARDVYDRLLDEYLHRSPEDVNTSS